MERETMIRDVARRLRSVMPMGLDVWTSGWLTTKEIVVMDAVSNTTVARLVFDGQPEPEAEIESACDAVVMRAAQSAALYRYCLPVVQAIRRATR